MNNEFIDEKKNNTNKILIAIIIILLLELGELTYYTFFVRDKEVDKPNPIVEPTKPIEEINYKTKITGNDLQDFDLNFLKIEASEKNIVYSPLSIKYALKMLSEGTSGTSKSQIDELLGTYSVKKYTNNSNMSFANAIFIKNTLKAGVQEKFVKDLEDKYNAEVIYDEFENTQKINEWVSNKSLNLINNLVNDVSEEDFYIVNALAINMDWKNLIQATRKNSANRYQVIYHHENYSSMINVLADDIYETIAFDNDTTSGKAVEIGASINKYDIVNELGEDNIRKTITKEYTDWLKKDECEEVEKNVEVVVNKYIEELNSNYKQLKASTDFKFYNDNQVKVFSKELKEYNGIALEYVGIMPKEQSLMEYVKNLTAKNLNETINKTKDIVLDNFEDGKITKITGKIPLYKYSYQLHLIDDLKKLGVTDIFEKGKANLTEITKDANKFINSAIHKANIEFSNEGIKAASSTSVGGGGGSICKFEYLYNAPVITIDLTFNNPYLYLIRDKNSGEIWFVGTVYELIPQSDIIENCSTC